MIYDSNKNYFILTGAMGAGKSTVLQVLKNLGLHCLDEPARDILAEQRSIQADGVPEKNAQLFTNLLLSRAIYQYKQNIDKTDIIIFDRGIPDNIGYAQLFNLETDTGMHAAKLYQYNPVVFFLPAWEAIYENDEERKMSFAAAEQFGNAVKVIYEALGYTVIDVPLVSPVARAEFIIEQINKVMPKF